MDDDRAREHTLICMHCTVGRKRQIGDLPARCSACGQLGKWRIALDGELVFTEGDTRLLKSLRISAGDTA